MRQSTAHILTSRRARMASPILAGLTSDPELASLAAYYAHVFLACIPMRVLRSQVLQYFSAQKIVGPQARRRSPPRRARSCEEAGARRVWMGDA